MRALNLTIMLATSMCCLCAQTAFAGVIYHAFDMTWNQVKANLPDLKKRGYTHIQISPPQQSNPGGAWYCNYQPYDFTVLDSRYGTELELKDMIAEAHKPELDLKIIVDFVFNQMSNRDLHSNDITGVLRYPMFSPWDFHSREGGDERTMWLNGDLPDLRTETPYVRQQAKNYAQRLIQTGADGFRFDAVKHIEPEFFAEVLKSIPAETYAYGEVLDTDLGKLWSYANTLPVTDFKLLNTMVRAFTIGQDIRVLRSPSLSNNALPGVKAVTFARNHDTAMSPQYYPGLIFGDYQDSLLAQAYVLSRAEGFPFVYKDDAYNDLVQAAVYFHEAQMGQPEYFRNLDEYSPGLDNPSLLAIERGSRGLALINKSATWFDVPKAKMPALETGCYKDLHHGFTMAVEQRNSVKQITRWGSWSRSGLRIGPRDAIFFVPTDWKECQN